NLGDLLGLAPGGEYWLDQRTSSVWPFGQTTKILNDGSLSTSNQAGWYDSLSNPDAAGSAYFGEPTSQIDLLRALHPRVVTLTIGGNDLGFADIIETCIFEPCRQWFANPAGPDQIDTRLASLAPLLEQAFADVRAAAGTSNVYAVTYPSPVAYDPGQPSESTDCTMIYNSDRQWLNAKLPELTNTIITAAKQAGIKYIDISTLFSGHAACTQNSYVIKPAALFPPTPWDCYTVPCSDNWFHPDTSGYQAMEQAIAAKITF
ncbi:MAG TPA: GDSL-type esterase/lipase family protein, partial [Streptosporangiaceae bacterium]|nr:GDSL-type esterase/lipase family protein [Streptosporangiaceae bacterium]